MKTLLILLNLAISCFYIIFLITNFDTVNIETSYLPILIIVTFTLNLIFLFSPSVFKNSWLSLYLKRKTLEEKKKIDELSSK